MIYALDYLFQTQEKNKGKKKSKFLPEEQEEFEAKEDKPKKVRKKKT